MKCPRSRKLIDIESYASLSAPALRELELHASQCSECAAYRKAARACIAALTEDAAYVDETSDVARMLFDRVCARVRGRLTTLKPQAAVPRPLSWSDDRLSGVPSTARKLMTTVAASLLIALTIMFSVAHQPSQSVDAIAVRRMFSICVQEAPNGRVYASVASRTAAGKIGGSPFWPCDSSRRLRQR